IVQREDGDPILLLVTDERALRGLELIHRLLCHGCSVKEGDGSVRGRPTPRGSSSPRRTDGPPRAPPRGRRPEAGRPPVGTRRGRSGPSPPRAAPPVRRGRAGTSCTASSSCRRG